MKMLEAMEGKVGDQIDTEIQNMEVSTEVTGTLRNSNLCTDLAVYPEIRWVYES